MAILIGGRHEGYQCDQDESAGGFSSVPSMTCVHLIIHGNVSNL